MAKLHHWVGIWRRTDQSVGDKSYIIITQKEYYWTKLRGRSGLVGTHVLRAFDRSARYFPKPLVYPELVEWEIDDESTGV